MDRKNNIFRSLTMFVHMRFNDLRELHRHPWLTWTNKVLLDSQRGNSPVVEMVYDMLFCLCFPQRVEEDCPAMPHACTCAQDSKGPPGPSGPPVKPLVSPLTNGQPQIYIKLDHREGRPGRFVTQGCNIKKLSNQK